MTRRIELKSIAAGVLGSFISRNNDFEGYWAIGLLYRYAQKQGVGTLEVEIFAPQDQSDKLIDAVRTKYQDMLLRLLERRGIPKHWLQSAMLRIEFEHPLKPSAVLHIHEHPFLASFTISSDLGKIYSVTQFGACWPHDPKRENCSNRKRALDG